MAAAQVGKLFLLKEGATTVAAMRSTSVSINGETIDISTKDSGGFRELLGGAGIVSMALSASGIFTDDASQTALVAYALDNSSNAFTIEDETANIFAGDFIITSCEQSGEYNGEQTFSLSMESSSTVTYTLHA